jgi:DNA topoisomerase-1
MKLVDAAEARRILDRLFGYEVSPILWRKVNRGLSAGRVQSPAIRLVVEREQERMAHVSAAYWDLEAATTTEPKFTATLQSVDGKRIATGKDFDSFGVAKDGIVVIHEEVARCAQCGRKAIPQEPEGSVYDQHLATRGRQQTAHYGKRSHAFGPRFI